MNDGKFKRSDREGGNILVPVLGQDLLKQVCEGVLLTILCRRDTGWWVGRY